MYKKKGIALLLVASMLLAGCGTSETFDDIKLTADKEYEVTGSMASVHDPSVVRDTDGTYYIFGSHLASAKTDDLINWQMISNKVSIKNKLMPNAIAEMPETFSWAQTGTLWAPDVIQLSDGRYYMYYCACEGSSPLSDLGIAVSDKIDGPYKDLGLILKSGMTTEPSEDGDTYDATVQPNVVDPSVYFDQEGRLWMMYGSYSGGIFVKEMDPDTGFPLEDGYGKKILGKNHLRIEAPYVMYNPETKYYYMFLSFGGFAADGAYNMRVCRSKNPDGPFLDAEGQDMIQCQGPDGTTFDDEAAAKYGTKIMGNYKWLQSEGEDGDNRRGIVSPGHNSAVYDEESGRFFLVYHSRFEGKGEQHSVRVNQMWFNEDGWPVVAPYAYTGETIGSYTKEDIAGPYKFINHGHDTNVELHESEDIILYSNGKISGAHEGKWKLSDGSQAEITIDGVTYKGVFVEEYDEYGNKYVMTFTALSEENGQTIWGSALAARDK